MTGNKEWQPIETAPKDGTIIILCDNNGDVDVGHYIRLTKTEGLWCVEGANPWETCHDSSYFKSYLTKGFEPTHWQPLPEPPEENY